MKTRDYIYFNSTPEPNSGCWLWNRYTTRLGYGQCWNDGGSKLIHRIAYELFIGPIPVGMDVCHKCDVPSCVNPDHLFIGTHADNMADKKSKGRVRVPCPLGSNHPNSKLTEADVIAIRSDPRMGTVIAAEYGVTKSLISYVRNRRGWKHV